MPYAIAPHPASACAASIRAVIQGRGRIVPARGRARAGADVAESQEPVAVEGTPVPTVLVVEDDAGVADTIVEALHQAGMRTVHANRGDSGLSAARTLRFGAIVLDLILPGRSGLDVLRELRGHPTLRDVPVVVVSAMAHRVPPAI